MESQNERSSVSSSPKVAWWKYPLSIFAFALAYLLLPALIGLLMELLNIITPNFYKSSYVWRFVISDVLGVSYAFYAMNKILGDSAFAFQTVVSVIVAVYSIFVAAWNWAFAASTLEQLLGMLAIGITSIVYAVLNGRKIGSQNK